MKTTKWISSAALSLVLSLGVALALYASGKEEDIKLEDCPDAVQKTIKSEAGDGKILEVEKETNGDGKVTYEAEVKKSNGTVIEIEVAADGTLIGVEEEEDDDDEDDDEDEDDA
jgi:hypothetical protein